MATTHARILHLALAISSFRTQGSHLPVLSATTANAGGDAARRRLPEVAVARPHLLPHQCMTNVSVLRRRPSRKVDIGDPQAMAGVLLSRHSRMPCGSAQHGMSCDSGCLAFCRAASDADSCAIAASSARFRLTRHSRTVRQPDCCVSAGRNHRRARHQRHVVDPPLDATNALALNGYTYTMGDMHQQEPGSRLTRSRQRLPRLHRCERNPLPVSSRQSSSSVVGSAAWAPSSRRSSASVVHRPVRLPAGGRQCECGKVARTEVLFGRIYLMLTGYPAAAAAPPPWCTALSRCLQAIKRECGLLWKFLIEGLHLWINHFGRMSSSRCSSASVVHRPVRLPAGHSKQAYSHTDTRTCRGSARGYGCKVSKMDAKCLHCTLIGMCCCCTWMCMTWGCAGSPGKLLPALQMQLTVAGFNRGRPHEVRHRVLDVAKDVRQIDCRQDGRLAGGNEAVGQQRHVGPVHIVVAVCVGHLRQAIEGVSAQNYLVCTSTDVCPLPRVASQPIERDVRTVCSWSSVISMHQPQQSGTVGKVVRDYLLPLADVPQGYHCETVLAVLRVPHLPIGSKV